jgi:hypothetical protein
MPAHHGVSMTPGETALTRSGASSTESGGTIASSAPLAAARATVPGNAGYAARLRQIVAVAQQDEHVARLLADFTAVRRAALRALLERGRDAGELSQDADLDMLVDMAYGVLYYRLLVGHAPLDENAARSLAAELTRSGGSA